MKNRIPRKLKKRLRKKSILELIRLTVQSRMVEMVRIARIHPFQAGGVIHKGEEFILPKRG